VADLTLVNVGFGSKLVDEFGFVKQQANEHNQDQHSFWHRS
jgi:hypothetical protein